MDAKIDWLLECADRLRAEHGSPIDIPKLFGRLGIELRTVSSRSGAGVVARSDDGRFVVIVKQYNPTLLWSPRDRFTAAHELGHILLIEKWNLCPPPTAHHDYHVCERLCNRFAGRLLVDPVLSANTSGSPGSALESILGIAKTCEVSLEVAAREFVSHNTGVTFSRVAKRYDETVCHLMWGVSSLKGIRETRRRQMPEANATRAVLKWCEIISGPSFYSLEPSSAQHEVRHNQRLVCVAIPTSD